jgi:hypothetical protein
MIEGKKKPSSTPKNSESVAELGEVAVSNMMTNTKKLNSIAKTLKPRK